MPSCLDHITIVASSLEAGSAFVLQSLGVEPTVGRKHPSMGTHNRLLSLGERAYLEVISPDPDASPISRPRWFGLDQVSRFFTPRLAAWVASTDDIEATALPAMGSVETMSREGHTWKMTLTRDGSIPLSGAVPALIQRSSHVHPASALTDVGLRIRRLQIHHPEPSKVRAALAAIHLSPEPEVTILHADACHLVAEIDTPAGAREIGLN